MRWRPEGHAGHLRIARVRWFSLAAPEPDNTARREIARQEHPIRSMGNTPVEKRGDLHGFKRIIQLEDLPRSAPRNDDRWLYGLAFEPTFWRWILTPGRRASVACRACTSTSGCLCTASPFRWARLRLHMSLAALRLHHGRRTGDAVPEGAAVAGATPLFRCLVRHRGGLDVHAHPPSVGRSLPSSNPVREGHRSPGTGASRTWRLGLWPEPSGVPRLCSVMPGCQTAGRSANG